MQGLGLLARAQLVLIGRFGRLENQVAAGRHRQVRVGGVGPDRSGPAGWSGTSRFSWDRSCWQSRWAYARMADFAQAIGLPNAPDIYLGSMYDPDLDEVAAYEELVRHRRRSHAG